MILPCYKHHLFASEIFDDLCFDSFVWHIIDMYVLCVLDYKIWPIGVFLITYLDRPMEHDRPIIIAFRCLWPQIWEKSISTSDQESLFVNLFIISILKA